MRRSSLAGLLAPIALVALALLAPATPAFANATITILNDNLPGVGFNDPTPVAPVGGNPGTTLGQQRLIAFQFAASIWGATLDSNVPISILSSFVPLSCNATSATLGSAGTIFIWSDFGGNPPYPGREFPQTWYSQALSSKRLGADINTQPICLNNGANCTTNADCTGGASCTDADIRARFNVNLGNAGCLTGIGWYLGLDNNHGNNVDLVTVLLHEFGHGLGFQQFASLTTGAQIPPAPGAPGQTDVYGRRLLDTSTNKTWDTMINAERVASALNYGRVVWTGGQVTSEVPGVLAFGIPNMRVNSPGAIAGDYSIGGAQFGGAVTAAGISGNLIQALDPAIPVTSPTTTDGCSLLTNAADIAGNIALIDRGTCGFIVKAANAQAAGAIALVIANNAAGAPPPGLGGVDPTITIPVVSITLSDANTIKAQLGTGVNVSILLDTTLRAGADGSDRARLYAPNPVSTGSSISHWDTVAFPNQLMEPAINGDLTHNVTGVDLTLGLMRDIGWYPDADVEGIADSSDNCVDVANADQLDTDHDNLGDACDPDDDNDGVADGADNCPLDANSDQVNTDGDSLGNVCDPDDDNDGVADGADNCPLNSNADQLDTDQDGLGNACDADDDADDILDGADNCPVVFNPDQVDFDRDGIGDNCDPLTGPPQDKDQCKFNNGWARFNTPRTFPNQGLCICFVQAAHGEKCPTLK